MTASSMVLVMACISAVAARAGLRARPPLPPHRLRGTIPTFTFDSNSSDLDSAVGTESAWPVTSVHHDRVARQTTSTTTTCRFQYGMASLQICQNRDACTLNISTTVFRNLRYGVDRLALSCGLPPGQCYPGGVDAAGNYVGCCTSTCPESPSSGGQRQAVGALSDPLNATDAATELVDYPTTDDRVVFPNPSWRKMTPYTRQKLTALANLLSNITGGAGLAVFVTDGFIPAVTGQNFTGETSLTWEGRELGLVMGRKPSTVTPSQRTAQTNAILTPTNATIAAVNVLNNQLLFVTDQYVRQLAEMCWVAGFNWLENSGRSLTGAWIPHVQVASVTQTCGGTIDLAFLLDGSGSVGLNGWQDQLEFALRVAGRFRVAPGGTHVAISTFGGPRERDGSHFQPGSTYATNVSTGQPCNVDSQCHNLLTTSVESCSVTHGDPNANGTCFTTEPLNCPIGTAFASINFTAGFNQPVTTIPTCMCPLNRSCTGPTAADCGTARYRSNACTGPISSCPIRSYFNLSCPTCFCDLSASDYRWNENHSAWTDIPFSAGINISTLNRTIFAGMNQYCPSVSSPAWATKVPFCFPDAASHLSLGLREVYESVFYHPDVTGVRPASARVPRVLVTISDGLANSFMEADEWAAQLKLGNPDALPQALPGVEMISVGTSRQPNGNYIPQLIELASAPVERHMFRVDSPSALQDLVDEIGQEACTASIQVGSDPIVIIIDNPSDAGTTFFEFICGLDININSSITVVVQSVGETELIVANVVNPTIADHGITMSRATGTNMVTVRGGAMYAAVNSATTFTIAVYLNVFASNSVSVRLPWTASANSILYTPIMTSISPSYNFTIVNTTMTSQAMTSQTMTSTTPVLFSLVNTMTGAVQFTPAGAVMLLNATNTNAYLGNYTVMLMASVNAQCSGVQSVNFYRSLNALTWGLNGTAGVATTVVTGLEEWVGDGCPYFNTRGVRTCGWPRRVGAIPASVGAIVVDTISLTDSTNSTQLINYTISVTGNTGGNSPFGLINSLSGLRRQRRLTSTGPVSVVITQPQLLVSGSTWSIVVRASILGVVQPSQAFTVSVPGLLPTSATPYISLASTSRTMSITMQRQNVGLDFTSTFPAILPVFNPSAIDFVCLASALSSSSALASALSITRNGNSCVLSYAAVPSTSQTPVNFTAVVNVTVSIGGQAMIPAIPLTVQVNFLSSLPTESPTAAPTSLPTSSSPTTPPTTTPAPTTPAPTSSRPTAPLATAAPTNSNVGPSTSEQDSEESNKNGTIAGVIIGAVLCVLFLFAIIVILPRRKKKIALAVTTQDGRAAVVQNAVYEAGPFAAASSARPMGIVTNATYSSAINGRGGALGNSTYSSAPTAGTNASGYDNITAAGGMYDSVDGDGDDGEGYLHVAGVATRPAFA